MTIAVQMPRGATWTLEDANEKLQKRATLPGARVFDLASVALRNAAKNRVSTIDRLALALPASWMVNSPANSQVMRRWALAPGRDAWVALADALAQGPRAWLEDMEMRSAVETGLPALGDEPFVIEAASKFLALLAPETVPLMPKPARDFVLGENAPPNATSFVQMIDWFSQAILDHDEELTAIANAHEEVQITGPQALDRLLWFDSEGHRHFEKK